MSGFSTQQTRGGEFQRPANSGNSRNSPRSGELRYEFDGYSEVNSDEAPRQTNRQRPRNTTRDAPPQGSQSANPRPRGFASSSHSAHQQYPNSEQAYFMGQERVGDQRVPQASNNPSRNAYQTFSYVNAGQSPQVPYGPSYDNANGPQTRPCTRRERDCFDCQPHPTGCDCLACRPVSSGLPTGRRRGDYERSNLGSDFFVFPSNHADQHNPSPYDRPANEHIPRTPSPARTSTRPSFSRAHQSRQTGSRTSPARRRRSRKPKAARREHVNWEHFNNPAWIDENGNYRFPRPNDPPHYRSPSLSPTSLPPQRGYSDSFITSPRFSARSHYATSSRRHRSPTPPPRSLRSPRRSPRRSPSSESSGWDDLRDRRRSSTDS
jgi:hypothetical protein